MCDIIPPKFKTMSQMTIGQNGTIVPTTVRRLHRQWEACNYVMHDGHFRGERENHPMFSKDNGRLLLLSILGIEVS